jgi:hypothetical protein
VIARCVLPTPLGAEEDHVLGALDEGDTKVSSERVSDYSRDKTHRGEPTHSPYQQLRHAAGLPVLVAKAPDTGEGAESTSVKKEPRRVRVGQEGN